MTLMFAAMAEIFVLFGR